MHRAILLSGADWALPGSSADLFFARDGGSYAINGNPANLTSLISTSRASTGFAQWADGHLSSFAADAPRITDLGLLVEQISTNIVLESQTFWGTSPGWGSLQGVAASQVGTAPDLTATAWKLQESASGTMFHQLQGTAVATTANSTYTFSVFMQAGTLGFGQLSFVSGGDFFFATFDLAGAGGVAQTGFGGVGVFISAAVTPLINGWYRASVTGSLPETSATPRITLCRSATDGFGGEYDGAGTGYISIWGAQVENVGFATSYIPTTTSTVTRAGDLIVLQGAALTAALNSQAARFVTNEIRGSIANLWLPNGANELLFPRTTAASIIAGGGGAANVAIGDSGTIAGLIKSAFSYNAAGNTAVANGGTLVSNVRGWTGTTGGTNALGNFSGTFPFTGLFIRATFGPTYGAFNSLTIGTNPQ